jgi:hypothetical protein
MTDLQLALSPSPHENHGLFADHYLDHVLPVRAEWRAIVTEAAPALARLQTIFSTFVPSNKEAQTEADLIRPVLDALGHTYEVQANLHVPGSTNSPDYVFFCDTDAKNAHKTVVLDKRLPESGGIAVGDAKYWDRPLDSAQTGSSASGNQNPAFQIFWYVLHSGVAWGLLTNGRRWRLVHRDTADRLDVFYEVDLKALVDEGNVERFLFFYGFFRRAAFEPGPVGLEALLSESTDYAHAVGNGLKAQVFDALRHLSQGFLDYAPNGLQTDGATLAAIYDNSLILLYRLIFVLFAEARELLPVRESRDYRESYSLQAITRDIAADLLRKRHLLAGSALLWPRLRELFRSIDAGNPPLRVATFNGGLFDPDKHPFLERYAVGDAHLQQAIDKLARIGGQNVDYRDLAVRHMGTIYEGLLEFQLQPLDVPEEGWTVALVNDKGERKATGSYYTPEYIVKFIVDRTVGPALLTAVEGKATDAAKVAAVLEVNVLDPAMGSGHFLVEAVEYIARYLVNLGVATTGKTAEEADLAFWKRRVAQSCVYGVDLNPLAVELAKLSLWLITVAKDRPLSFLDHHLRPGNSLVGARLTALEAHGASSAVKKKRQAVTDDSQTSLFGGHDFTVQMANAVGSMWLIEESDAASVAQVKEQEALYAQIRERLIGRFGKLADLLTARHFGLEIPDDRRQFAVDFVMGRALAVPQAIQEIVETATALARQERFFHWELEFPEVYFDRYGRSLGDEGGFEAVIGNPPYIRQERLARYKPYFQEAFQTFHGVADLYLYFYERGLEVAQRDARLAFISSGTFARANFATPFRQWLPTAATFETLIDFGENQPFPGAEMVRPSIAVLRKRAGNSSVVPVCATFRSLFIGGKIPPSLDVALETDGIDCDPSALEQSEWTFKASNHTRLIQKIMGGGRPLNEVVQGRLLYGVKTGLNEAFVIDQATGDRLKFLDPGCTPLIKKMLRGEDLRPWYQEDEGRWLITLPCGWTSREFGSGKSEEDAWQHLAGKFHALAEYCRRAPSAPPSCSPPLANGHDEVAVARVH